MDRLDASLGFERSQYVVAPHEANVPTRKTTGLAGAVSRGYLRPLTGAGNVIVLAAIAALRDRAVYLGIRSRAWRRGDGIATLRAELILHPKPLPTPGARVRWSARGPRRTSHWW